MKLNAYLKELIRPWKLTTFSIAFAWLIYGAFNFHFPGWNPGVSFILGILAYTTAPLAMRTIREGFKAATFMGMLRAQEALMVSLILSVGVFYSYNTWIEPNQIFPEALTVTFAAYLSTGILWAWRGTLEEFTKLDGREYIENYIHLLAHEMKSPLTALIGAAELLDEDLPPEDRAKFTANIREQSQRLKDMLDELLALAHVERRTELDHPEQINLRQLVEAVISDHTVRMRQRGISCHNKIPPDWKVLGEAFLLRQAVANLLNNAIDFSPVGGEIDISLQSTKKSLTLVLQDQGPGIPEYALPQLFERFYSLARPGTQRKSTGLGLPFVREVATLHGGHIELMNRNGVGTEARLTFPLP